MTRGDLPERWLNRPVKPVAIGTLLATGALCLNQFLSLTGNKTFLYTPQGSIGTIFVLSLITTVLMFGSWIAVSQHMYQVSLLFGVGTWVGRAVEVALAVSLACAVIFVSMLTESGVGNNLDGIGLVIGVTR